MHQPQPSSSEQPHTVVIRAHVSMHRRRHDDRHVLWVDGHSRQVVVHSPAGRHVLLLLHQPHPGALSEHAQTSAAMEQTLTLLALIGRREVCDRPAKPSANSTAISTAIDLATLMFERKVAPYRKFKCSAVYPYTHRRKVLYSRPVTIQDQGPPSPSHYMINVIPQQHTYHSAAKYIIPQQNTLLWS